MPENKYICDCDAVNQEMVEDVLSKMPDSSVFKKLNEFFKIMGDMTGCKILFALLQSELCVCDLANVMSMTKSSVSHQLSKMKKADLVKFRREGKKIFYSLDDTHVAEVFSTGIAHIEHSMGEEKNEN